MAAITRDEKIAIGGAVVAAGILTWWLWPKAKAVARRKSEYVIDDNVMSPTFGLPVYGPPAPAVSLPSNPAVNPDMRRLIDESNAAIAKDDAENKG